MSDCVTGFISARKRLLDAFKCKDEYPIKTCLDYNWAIAEKESVVFLTYYKEGGEKCSSVVVKNEGLPMIYKYGRYTMIVAIECVKTAIVFKNDLKDCD